MIAVVEAIVTFGLLMHRSPADRHPQVDKKSGLLAHLERWNNYIRRKPARYVRKTLFFSKLDQS